MRWLHTEYILKGVYLGLLLFVALQEPSAEAAGRVALWTLGGLAACLAVAAFGKLRQGYRVQGRLLAFILFLMLESPTLVYAGILGGLAVGTLMVFQERNQSLLSATVAGGVVLGVLFGILRQLRQKGMRLVLSLLLGVGLVVGALYWFGWFGESPLARTLENPQAFALPLLLGIPIFYLLTFAGKEEESEVEIGAMCASLGLGLGLLLKDTRNFPSIGFLAPIMIFFFYTSRVMPGLRVFKHTLRGMSYAKIGRLRQALLSFRRALQLDPHNRLAQEGMWNIHRSLDMDRVADDPELLAAIDLDLCLNRAGALVLESRPSQPMLEEAHRLLNLVASQRPTMEPAVDYWRAVAHCHGRQFDQAAAALERVLDPAGHSPGDPHRNAVLLAAWQLALVLHPEMNRRVGQVQLPLPGRRMEAIAAVERHLAENADDAEVWTLKRQLYSGLIEAEYESVTVRGAAAAHFDHGYAQQLGLALIDDPVRWQRGGEYLRIAARGLPALGPTIFTQIAQAHEKAGNLDGARHNWELAKRAGLAVGHKNLGAEDRQVYFATLKKLAEDAVARGDLDAAAENYQLYTEYERSGVETLRTLAELHERRGDALSALRCTEQALVYNAKDKQLLERKDRYYYSVTPEQLRQHIDWARKAFDVAYCLKKARSLLDAREIDLDVLDWATHLVELARVVKPDSQAVLVLLARAKLRRGAGDQALTLLEDVRTGKPEKFASGEDEDAWYVSCKLLGEMYLNELARPDLAVQAFQDFRKSTKSGADTLYKLGQAYEQLGDRARAVKCYEHVVSYDGHPLAPDARDALYRLQAS